MTATFPRQFPGEFRVVGLDFRPLPVIELDPTRGGEQIGKNLGPTLWRGEWRSTPQDEEELGIIRAFYDTILSERHFFGYDHIRVFPLVYAVTGFAGLTVGGSPWNGEGSLVTVTDSKVVTINGLPVGFELRPGDYLAFNYGAKPSRALHRCSEAAVANGSGQLTVEVRPFVRVGWAADAAVFFHKASARMVIEPGSYSDPVRPPAFGTVSFQAVQSL